MKLAKFSICDWPISPPEIRFYSEMRVLRRAAIEAKIRAEAEAKIRAEIEEQVKIAMQEPRRRFF